MTTLKPITSLGQLYRNSTKFDTWAYWLKISAENLGFYKAISYPDDWSAYLEMQADALGGDAEIIDEVNFVLDIVQDAVKERTDDWIAFEKKFAAQNY